MAFECVGVIGDMMLYFRLSILNVQQNTPLWGFVIADCKYFEQLIYKKVYLYG